MTPADPEEIIAALIKQLVGEERAAKPDLVETPKRYAAALQSLVAGYHTKPADFIKTFAEGGQNYDGIVFQGRIQLYSLCEHHMLPFFGVAHVGYIPTPYSKHTGNGGVIGLSKIARIVNMFAQRLQVQERLTREIAECLSDELAAQAVGVVIRCRHMCMEMRGVQKPNTVTYTSTLLGDFRNEGPARSEFMSFVAMADQGLIV